MIQPANRACNLKASQVCLETPNNNPTLEQFKPPKNPSPFQLVKKNKNKDFQNQRNFAEIKRETVLQIQRRQTDKQRDKQTPRETMQTVSY